MIKYFFVFALVFSANIFSQPERYTKGAENGYTWISMEDPNQFYSTSKETYLSSILERIRLTGEKYPEIESLSCKEDMKKLFSEGKSDEISMEDIVNELDKFYSEEQSLVVPIIFAYCYTIKKISGVNETELADYKNQVLEFCEE
ncbi:MAG: hypothetical protein EHM47_14550 [Ignavibacteriales bacterium]|nr:MAG: hypothetical protein EHM47_14550 [Ignavibacteriales bacterium]